VASLAASLGRQLGDFRALLNLHNYQRLWAAQIISTCGDRFTQIALTTLIFTITRSDAGIGLVLAISVLPQALFSIPAGVAADRFSRRGLLVTTDLARAAIVLFLGLRVGLPVGAVYLLAGLHATATAFFVPTRYALLPDIVQRRQLMTANALDETSQNTVDPIAYLVAGAVVAGIGLYASFAIDSLTFVLSAALIAAITVPVTRRPSRNGDSRRGVPERSRRGRRSTSGQDLPGSLHEPGWAREATQGLRFIWKQPQLRANTILVMLATLVASSEYPLSYMMVFGRWNRGPLGLGIIEAALAVGIVCGGFLCSAVVRGAGRGVSILVGLAGTGMAMAATAVLPFWFAVAAIAVSGIYNTLYFVPTITLQQELAPNAIRGRVLSSRRMLTALTIFASYALATALVSVAAPATLIGIFGLMLLGTALCGFAFPVLRQR
jgi:MFS family permease